MKPILFNTDMVRAILNNRKTVTRRAVKGYALYHLELDTDGSIIGVYNQDEGHVFPVVDYAPYRPGDILYVRETFCINNFGCHYRADWPDDNCPDMSADDKWRPSIHMPREASRIFLRVTDVRVERLQDITDEQALREGVPEDTDYPLDSQTYCPVCKGVGLVGTLHPVSLGYMEVDCTHCDTPTKRFANFWNSTIKPADHALYGWQANPWVWVIEFERCEMLKGA